MRSIMLDQIRHALLQYLVRRALAERKHMLDSVSLLLVEPTAFDADCVHDERREGHGHLHFLSALSIFLLVSPGRFGSRPRP